MGIKDRGYGAPDGICFYLFRIAVRLLQFVAGLVVAGLYGQDLNTDHQQHKHADSKWIFATVVAGMACLTAFVYSLPKIPSLRAFFWDWFLFLLWLVVFGIFGKMYIHQDPKGNKDIERMRTAVWFDAINLVLWFVSAVYSTFFSFRGNTHSYNESEV